MLFAGNWPLLWLRGGGHACSTHLLVIMAIAAAASRVSECEREGIRRAVVKACAEAGATWRRIVLFGSRADLSRRGGDIDLLIELVPNPHCDTFRLNQLLRLALEKEIGEQRVDIVLDEGRVDDAFPALARERGIELRSNPWRNCSRANCG
jgi:predicted nucleotidyltransferase